jgi:general secretion pathway protein N
MKLTATRLPLASGRAALRTANRVGASTAAGAPWWPAFWGACLGLLFALLFFAPASWVAAAVGKASGERVVLQAPTGTVWNGSARLLLTGGVQSRDAAALPGRVHWTLSPNWRGLGLTLLADCCTKAPLGGQVKLSLKGASVALQDGSSQWPAQVLSGLGTPWNTVLLDGQLLLSTQGLSVEWLGGRVQLAGQLQLDALEVGSRLSTLKPLGTYRLVLAGIPTATDAQAALAQLTLETLSGDLRLSGSGQWVGSRLKFNGQASAAPEREAALANLLNILGRRQGPNSIISIG